MPERELTIAERVPVQKSLKAAIDLCKKIAQGERDDKLAAQVQHLMNLRPTTARLKGIRREFGAVATALSNTQLVNIKRDEGEKVYAYVYPHQPYHIWVGDDFFTAARSGPKDTTVGTLIHEATHWTIVKGSDDHAYGDIQHLSAALARNNADTLERIAESVA